MSPTKTLEPSLHLRAVTLNTQNSQNSAGSIITFGNKGQKENSTQGGMFHFRFETKLLCNYNKSVTLLPHILTL